MAKTTAPLLSFGAGGQIAKTAVYAKWRGRSYVRRHVIPANPQSTEQTKTRSLFSWLNQVWKNMGSLAIAPWNAYATGQAFLGRNAFIGQNISAMRDETDVQLMVFSPGAKGGLAPTSFSCAGGSGTLTGTVATPTPPTGWTIAAAVMVAIEDQNPQSGVIYTTYTGEDTSDPYTAPAIAAVPAGDYVIGCYLRWTKPDGSTAYSVSLLDTATVS